METLNKRQETILTYHSALHKYTIFFVYPLVQKFERVGRSLFRRDRYAGVDGQAVLITSEVKFDSFVKVSHTIAGDPNAMKAI